MTVLVTGGAGYIGSHTVRALRATGREVLVLDTLELGFEAATLGARLVVGNAGDGALVRALVDEHEIDSVVHFAGYKNAGESMQVPAKYFENNVVATARLLEALVGSSVRSFVFSGSCSVYGTPAVLPVVEQSPLQPESPYGQSKLIGEQLLRWHGEVHGLKWMSLRYFNASGASTDTVIGEDMSHTFNLVPLVMKAALGLRSGVQVYGTDFPTPDGTAVRDYIHVEDLADGHVRALHHLESDGESGALNLGTGTGSSVQQVIDLVAEVSGRTVPTEYVGRRAGDPAAVWADNRKATAALEWVPRHGLREIIESAWRWHESRPNGYT